MNTQRPHPLFLDPNAHELSPRLQDLLRLLFQLGAIKFGGFKLKLHDTNPDAPLSPIYANLRTSDNPKPGPLTSMAVDSIALEMMELVRQARLPPRYQHLAGIPNAGLPFALAFQRQTLINPPKLITLGKTSGEHARKITCVVDGDFQAGDLVLLLDDLITAADSKFEAIQALEESGLMVNDVVVLMDREQGGRNQLLEHGKRLHAAFTLRQATAFYRSIDWIDQAMFEKVFAYLAAENAKA